MTMWINSKMVTFYHTSPSDEWPCVVKIDEDEILVEYQDEGLVQYRGKNRSDGHFELLAPKVTGHASLHMFPVAVGLVGNWIEGNEKGMWQIELG